MQKQYQSKNIIFNPLWGCMLRIKSEPHNGGTKKKTCAGNTPPPAHLHPSGREHLASITDTPCRHHKHTGSHPSITHALDPTQVCHTHSHSHTHTHTRCLCVSVSPSLSLSLAHTHARTHTHTRRKIRNGSEGNPQTPSSPTMEH